MGVSKKGISTIISIILMLMITTALVGTTYIYISGGFTAAIRGIEIIDVSCIKGISNIMIRNIGDTIITDLTVGQTNPPGDTAQDWSGQLIPGNITTYTDVCAGDEPRKCIYNIKPSEGRSIKAVVQCMDVAAPTCLSDGEACTTGSECCNGICQDGTCVSTCGACGTACSEGDYPYTDGTHTCEGQVNDACNAINGVWYACTETGDSRDADCTGNCEAGLSYCSSGGSAPFYWGRCVDLQSDDCSCGTCGFVCPGGTVCQNGICTISGAGLVGYWEFEEGSGTTVGDSSGNGNDGTLYGDGDEWVVGRAGTGLDFDGTGDYVNVGNPVSLQLIGDMTISFWSYPKNIAENRENPIDKAYCGEFALTQETGGSLSYFQGPNGGETSGYMSRGWSGIFANNQWVHVALVRDVSAQSIRVYKNGVDQGEGGISWAVPSASSEPVTIGDGYAGAGFHGKIDEVRIYDRTLSSEEVKTLYESAINLVSNPSFEDDKTDWGTGAGDWTIVTDQKWHGIKSSMFVDTAGDAGSEQTSNQYIPVTLGEPITVSVYSKGQNIVLGSSSWHKALLIGRWYNATKTVISGYYPDMQIGDGVGIWDWKRSWITLTPITDAAYYGFSVGLRGSATGTLWVDAVQVEYGSTPSEFVS